jgi:transposase
MRMDTGTSVGIESAKARLDGAIRPSGAQWVSAPDPASLEELGERMQAL